MDSNERIEAETAIGPQTPPILDYVRGEDARALRRRLRRRCVVWFAAGTLLGVLITLILDRVLDFPSLDPADRVYARGMLPLQLVGGAIWVIVISGIHFLAMLAMSTVRRGAMRESFAQIAFVGGMAGPLLMLVASFIFAPLSLLFAMVIPIVSACLVAAPSGAAKP